MASVGILYSTKQILNALIDKDGLWKLLESLYPLEYDDHHCILATPGFQNDASHSMSDIRIENLDNAVSNFRNRGVVEGFLEHYIQHQRIHIKATDRLQIFNGMKLGDFHAPPTNYLDRFFEIES